MAMTQLDLFDRVIQPPVLLDVNNHYISCGSDNLTRLLGQAAKRYNGKWQVLADMNGMLVLLEVAIFTNGVDPIKVPC